MVYMLAGTCYGQQVQGNSAALFSKSNPIDSIGIFPASSFTSWNLTLPTTPGTANYFLQTNGSGVTTWALPSVDSVRIADTSIKSHYSDSSFKSDSSTFATAAGPFAGSNGEGSTEQIFDFEFGVINGNAGPYNIGYIPTKGTFEDFIITKVVWIVDTSYGAVGTYTYNLGVTAPNYADYVNAQPTAIPARYYVMSTLVSQSAQTAPVLLGSGNPLSVLLSGAPTIGIWLIDLLVFGYYRSYN